MKIKLTVPQLPESYNKIKDWHWSEKDKYNHMWYKEVWLAWSMWQKENEHYNRELPDIPYEKAKINFYIYFPDKHRRDKINYAQGCKPILDQLAEEKIIIDDNWNRIEDQYYCRCDKLHPRTEIEIEDYKKKGK